MAVSIPLFRTQTVFLVCAAFAGAVLCHVPAQAQEAGPLPTNLVTPRVDVSQKRFFWCAGVADQTDLDAYVAEGFDTLVIPLPWKADDAELSNTSFGPQRALAAEGAKRGLQILFSLPAAPEGLGISRISADSPSYTTLWTSWTQNVVASLKDTTNLVGWMLPDDSRGLTTFDDASFQRYLTTQFASIDALNTRWGTTYNDFSSVSIGDVPTLVTNWKAQNTASSGGSLAAPGVDTTPTDPNAAFAPAALYLANYKANAWKELMALWASTLRGSDSNGAVFSGACPDYAQLLAMPEGVDVSVAGVAPNVVESDFATYNPQAVDIARRAGTKTVVARFNITPTAELNATSIANLLPRWTDEALAHGARGVSFDSFGAIENNPVLADAVTKTLKTLKSQSIDPTPPIATLAVVLDPLAEGTTLQVGRSSDPRGLYGFGDSLVSGEPSTLVNSLRWGTSFGGVDYLSPEDLTSVDLGRYSTIMAPQLFDCSPETSQRLGDWMRAGGTFMADLGLGALQNGGSASALPPQMAQIAGGIGPFDLRSVAFNLRITNGHPLLPTWSKTYNVRPGMIFSAGDSDDGSAFTGAAGFAIPSTKAVTLAVGPSSRPGLITDTSPQVGLTATQVDQGYFIFAPFRLWASWRPGQLGFDALHGDLFSHGAQLAVPVDALTPFPANTKLGTTRFPEVVNRLSGVTFLNHDASGVPQNASLYTAGAGDWLWSNAIVSLLSTSGYTANGARPSPIFSPGELQSRPRPIALYTLVPPSQKVECRMRPITLQNLNGGTISAEIGTEKGSSLSLRVWGPTLSVSTLGNGAAWVPAAPDGVNNFRLSVYDSPDGYRCPPNSRHRVSITDFGTPAEGEKPVRKKGIATVQTVVADAQGCLKIEFQGTGSDLKIEPDTTVALPQPSKPRRAQ